MKKLSVIFTLFLAIAFSNNLKAQAWTKESKVIALGFGASQFLHIDASNYYGAYPYYYRTSFWRLTGQFNVQGEFGIHKWVGLGFSTGIGGAGQLSGYYPELNVPIAFIANFHFYQLIADKVSKDIHADKLDVYAGVSVGSGVAVIFDTRFNNSGIFPLVMAGPHVGVRYYFNDKVGINGELGFGKSLINAGVVFRLGGS
jgi:hypothetical protein